MNILPHHKLYVNKEIGELLISKGIPRERLIITEMIKENEYLVSEFSVDEFLKMKVPNLSKRNGGAEI